MTIAVYGGSFNPPHMGHVHAVQTADRVLHPDRFLILPDRVPPHKTLSANSPSPRARFEMCRIAFADIPHIEVSDMELRREGKSYTSDTVYELRQIYPEDELFLVIGSDMLLSFTEWHRFPYILQETVLAVLCREPGEDSLVQKSADELRDRYGAAVRLLPCVPYPASSTKIREDIASGICPPELAPEVFRYIREHRFYL